MECDGEEGCILVECAICRCRLATPEALCSHVYEAHGHDTPCGRRIFASKYEFQGWLDRVDGDRTEYAGMLDIAPHISAVDTEYYLLCGHSAIGAQKKRKLDGLDSNSDSELDMAPSPSVRCTAFIHVYERVDGSFETVYCFTHCAHPSSFRRKINNKTLKRTSSMMGFQNDETEERLPCNSSPDSDDAHDIHSNAITAEVSIYDHELTRYDLSIVNSHITARLDSTAARLKTLTTVLAKLAVDVQKCELSRHIQV
ncbi:unnamed protein product, partial [Mesorhabditis spiculigera]